MRVWEGGRRAAAWLGAGLVATAVAAAEPPKAPASFRHRVVELRDRFERDGSHERRQLMEVELLDAAAVAAFSQVGLTYAEEHQEGEVVLLVVVKPDGRELDLLASAPRDVAPVLPAALPIYSDLRLLRHAVPSLAVGDRLRFEWRLRSRPLSPGRAWAEYTLGAAADVDRQLYEIDLPETGSPKLFVREELGAPAEEVRSGGRWIRRWERLRPAEVGAPAGDAETLAAAAGGAAGTREAGAGADFRVTSFASWDEIADWWRSLAKVDPDRSVRAKAGELTAGLAEPRAKLAAIHRYVAQEIRYLTLPLGLGRYQPRSPDEVMRTGLGDCKDKHHLLASLAAAAGVDVDAVLIHANGLQLDERAPSPEQFDHVISRARLGDETIWMDATSEMTPMGRLVAGLRDVRAVAVPAGGAGAELVTTPAEPPVETRVETSTIGVLEPTGPIRAKVRWTFEGDDEAIRLLVKYGNEEARRRLIENYRGEWEDEAKIGAFAFGDPSDLATPFWFEYDVEWAMSASIWREAWDLWVPVPRTWIETPPKEGEIAGVLELEQPRRQIRRARLTLPPGVRATAPVPIAVDREFASYRSDYRVEDGAIVLERELVRKVDELPREKLGDLAAFRKVIADDRLQEFDFDAAPHLAAAEPAASESADELVRRGRDRYRDDDYAGAEGLFRRATEIEPRHGEAWDRLGNALYKLRRYDEAKVAYERQVEIDPHHDSAYSNLGRVAWKLGDQKAAESYYRKQIDVTPLDGYSHGQLGYLLLYQDRFAEAEELLTRAVKLDPDDLDWQESLLMAHLENGHLDAARELILRRGELPDDLEQHLRAFRLLIYDEQRSSRLSELTPWVNRLGKAARDALAGVGDPVPSVDLAVAATAVGNYWEALGRIALENGETRRAVDALRAALRITQGSSAAWHLAEALRADGRTDEAGLYYAMASTLDRRGAKLYGPSFAERVPEARERERLTSKSRDEYTLLRTLFRRVPAAKRSDGRALLLFDVDGRLLRAKAIDGDGARLLARNLEADPPVLAVPPGNDLRVVVWAMTYCSDEGSCSLILESPVQAWTEEVEKRDRLASGSG